MLIRKQVVAFICLLLVFIRKVRATKSIKVIDFPIGGSFESIAIGSHNETWKTKEIASCFKFMLRYNHGYTVLASDHFIAKIYSNGNGADSGYGFLNFVPNVGDYWYSRMFIFCNNSLSHGKWISMCLDMKLDDTSQLVRVYVGGAECHSQKYEDGHFGWLQMSKIFIGKSI